MPLCPKCGIRWYAHDNIDGAYLHDHLNSCKPIKLKVDNNSNDKVFKDTWMEVYVCSCGTIIGAFIKKTKTNTIGHFDHPAIDIYEYEQDFT